jgi:hypothetical protein
MKNLYVAVSAAVALSIVGTSYSAPPAPHAPAPPSTIGRNGIGGTGKNQSGISGGGLNQNGIGGTGKNQNGIGGTGKNDVKGPHP